MSDRRIGLSSPHEIPDAQLVISRGCLSPLSLRLSVHVHAEFYLFKHKVCYVTCIKGRMSYFLMTAGQYKHVHCFVMFVLCGLYYKNTDQRLNTRLVLITCILALSLCIIEQSIVQVCFIDICILV